MVDDKKYHNLDHTLEVVKVSKEIALAEKVTSEELEILEIAAWFHDTGHIVCCDGHEVQSSVYANEFLIKESYPKNKIKTIVSCIKSTKIPQSPKNKLDEILCDADLHHLGLPDIEEKGKLLRQELELKGIKKFNDLEWLKTSFNFLNHHKYFTEYAKEKYNSQKQINLLNLRDKIKRLEKNMN
jgi:predicted metal-dependent HD superfamily phosphohydrolase